MRAKPLTDEQREDAERLRSAFNIAKDARGLTQAQMAAECGWESQSTVSQYVRGLIPLNLDALARMCAVLKVPIGAISPALARQLKDLIDKVPADPITGGARRSATVTEPVGRLADGGWPFQRVSPERFRRLPPDARARVEGFVEGILAAYEAAAPQGSTGTSE